MSDPSDKKAIEAHQDAILRQPSHPSLMEGKISDNELEEHEVFKKSTDGVDFRTVTWQKAVIIFIKTQIAIGVLGIPGALGTLGAVGGGILIVAFQSLNCCAYIYEEGEN